MRCLVTSKTDYSMGLKKHVRDSMRYLYSNPQATYSKLVVTARRAESETKETKVKARSAAATEVPSSSKELVDQIARLMAALIGQKQSSCSASAPSSPRHRGHGRGQMDRNTSVCPNSHNSWTGLGQTSACSSSVVYKLVLKSNCNLAAGSLWSSYVRVTAAILQQLRETSNAKLTWEK